MRVRLLQALVLLTVILAVVVFFATGTHKQVDVEALRALLASWGAWGAVAYVLLFSILQALGVVSVYIFGVAASLVWPAPLAILLTWLGTLGSGLLSFAFSRYVARDRVQARLPEWVKRYDRRLATHGFRTVLVLRLITHCSSLIQLVYGASRVRFLPFLAATAIGNLPMVIVLTLLGNEISAWIQANPPSTWF